jgi:hypothetical protein
MPTILIRRINGAEHNITLKALDNWLVDDSRFGDVLGELLTRRNTVAEIIFRDGDLGESRETASLTFVSDDGPAVAPPDQAELPMRHAGHNVHVPTTEFEVDAMLLLRIPARISCHAASPEWAGQLIRQIVSGEANAPPGFSIDVETEFMEALRNSIDIADTSANPFRTIDVQDVIITRIRQRLLLEGSALSC